MDTLTGKNKPQQNYGYGYVVPYGYGYGYYNGSVFTTPGEPGSLFTTPNGYNNRYDRGFPGVGFVGRPGVGVGYFGTFMRPGFRFF